MQFILRFKPCQNKKRCYVWISQTVDKTPRETLWKWIWFARATFVSVRLFIIRISAVRQCKMSKSNSCGLHFPCVSCLIIMFSLFHDQPHTHNNWPRLQLQDKSSRDELICWRYRNQAQDSDTWPNVNANIEVRDARQGILLHSSPVDYWRPTKPTFILFFYPHENAHEIRIHATSIL